MSGWNGSGAWAAVRDYLKRFNTNIIPSADNTYDLGSSSKGLKDLYVSGSATIATSQTLDGTLTIDHTNAEALLVRKNSDGGDIFTVDTTNTLITFRELRPLLADLDAGDAFTISGAAAGELTDTDAVQNFLAITPHINQSSTAGYTGILLNVTETATGSGAKNLLDLQVGGASKFKITNDGTTTGLTMGGIFYSGGNQWRSGTGAPYAIFDLDYANTTLGFSSNNVGTLSFKTGTIVTDIQLDHATSSEIAFQFDYTVNKATSGNDTGLRINKTDTASPGNSFLLDLQTGGSRKASFDDTGILTFVDAYVTGGGVQLDHQTLTASTLTLDATDGVIECDTTSNAIAITLPECSTVLGQVYTVYFETDGGNDVTVTTASGDSYAGVGDVGDNTATMADVGDFITIQAASSTRWVIVQNNGAALTTV